VKTLTVADLFCGAGGSSTGSARACEELGVAYRLTAVNHWDVAIASHLANHPGAKHLRAEVDQLKSRDLASDGRLDILWASPACTEHSYAKGGHSVDDQNRVSAWAINREIERYRPQVIIVENVPPFRNWGPVEQVMNADGTPKLDKKGQPFTRPIKDRRGETFRAWFASVESMGYEGKWALLNSADFGEPQTRIRWFGIFTAIGVRVDFPAPTHGKPGTLGVDAGQLAPWVGAREIIDWNLRGSSIFERERPLSPNTMRRIEEGIRRYCSGPLAEAFIVVLRNHADAQSLDDPAPTITAGGLHVGLAETELRPFVGANRTSNMPVDVDNPVPTVTTATGGGLFMAEPFVLGQQAGAVAREVTRPLPTIATAGYVRVFEPMVVDYAMRDGEGSGKKPSPATPVDAPLGTVITRDRFGVVEPIVIDVRHGADAPARNASVDEPLSTLTARNGLGIAEPFIVPQQGDGTLAIDDPLDTLTTTSRGKRLVEPVAEPFLTSYYGESNGAMHPARGVDEPVPTVTTNNRFGLVEPYLVAHFGEREGQAPRTHSIDDPTPTVTHRGAGDLVEPVAAPIQGDAPRGRVVLIDGKPFVLDVRFRMLQPHELAAAQGFPPGYVFTGTKEAQTAQIGNAVPVGVAYALIRQALVALGFGEQNGAAA
jgi:DNA (cytosine-5)-methyltransferase 1